MFTKVRKEIKKALELPATLLSSRKLEFTDFKSGKKGRPRT